MGASQGKAGVFRMPPLSRKSLQKEAHRLQRERDEAEAKIKELQQQLRSRQGPEGSKAQESNLPTLLAGVLAEGSKAPPDQAPLRRVNTVDSTPCNYVSDPFAASLNDVLVHMWPAISSYVTKVLKEEVEPAVQAALPQAFKGLRFDPNRCSLGDQPPEFIKVTTTKEQQDTAQGSIENLVLRCRVDWKADCDICLEWGGISLGIKSLYVRGNLLVEMVSIITRPPMFEGLRMFFLNPPELDLDFQGAGHGLLNLSLIKANILQVIEEQLSSNLVVPNRMGMKLDLDADIFRITSPPSEGILKVHVCGAQKLIPMDVICCGQGTSDPYVQVRCGAHVSRSPARPRTLNPRFDHEVCFPISSPHQRVKLTLYDEDTLSQDDFLGKLSLPVSVLVKLGDQEVTHRLQDEEGCAEGRGQVTLRAEWRPLLMSSEGAADQRGAGILFAGLYNATGVPDHGEGALYYVSMSCGGLMPGAFSGPHETNRLPKSQPPADTWETQAKSSALRSKMTVLKKYNMSEEDMAGVLEVDPTRLRRAMALASTTAAIEELERSEPSVRVEWEQGYEFLVEDLTESTVTFELRCQTKGSSGSSLIGTGQWSASLFRGSPLVTVPILGTTAKLNLRIRLLHLQEPATQMVLVRNLVSSEVCQAS